MSESNDHTALLEAAAAVETQVTARAFIDAVYEAGINWHPDDPFTEIVTYETRAALFTEDQAAKLDAAASRVHELLEGDEVYEYGLEIMKAGEDKALLETIGCDHTTVANRTVPGKDNTPDFDTGIKALLKHHGLAYTDAKPDLGFVLVDHPIAIWATPDVGPCMEFAYAISAVTDSGGTIEEDTIVTRSTTAIDESLQRRLGIGGI